MEQQRIENWTHVYTGSDGQQHRCIVLEPDRLGLLWVAVESSRPVPLGHPQRYAENATQGFALPTNVRAAA